MWAGLAVHTTCAQHPPALSPCSLKKDLGPGQGTASLAEIRFGIPGLPKPNIPLHSYAHPLTRPRGHGADVHPAGLISDPHGGAAWEGQAGGEPLPSLQRSCRFLKAKTPSQMSILKNCGRLCPSSCRPWTLS